MQKLAIRGDARQIASTADDSANSRASFVLWRFLSKVVGATGFEPATPCAQGRCATRLRYAPTPIRLDLTASATGTPIARFAWVAKIVAELSQNCEAVAKLSSSVPHDLACDPLDPLH